MRVACACVVSLCSLTLAGCSVVSGIVSANPGSNIAQGGALQGVVHGGQQPIVGASVYLYAVGTSGYGGPSVSLLTSAANTTRDTNGNYYVTTDSGGGFTITGDYTCPAVASQVYLYSIGGNPGAGANSGAALLAGIGTCPAGGTLSSSLFISMNEVSTIATAYSLAGFGTAPLNLSTSGTALAKTGLANAFSTITNLESLGAGTSLATTPAGNGTVPQSRINTLANILAACINSTGPSSTACSTLFTNTGSATDTATAAIYMARNAGNLNFSALFGLQTGTSPFQPSLTSAPSDFTIAINYTGGLHGPSGVAVDASGNVWVANTNGGTVNKFSPTGAVASGSPFSAGGISSPTDIAIDSSGNAWITNTSSISELNSTGAAVSGSPFTGGGLNGAFGIAIDQLGRVWVANKTGNSISEFASTGTAISGAGGITTGGLNGPILLAVDPAGNIWVTNNTGGSVSEFNASGIAYGGSPFSGAGLSFPTGIALDASGHVWAADVYNNNLTELTSSGSPVSGSPFSGGGMLNPYAIAMGGSLDLWVADNGANSISRFNTSTGAAATTSSGDTGGGLLNGPYGLAVDGSANVWVTNNGGGSGTTLTEFVGASAGPVVTPVVANLLAPYGTQAVNKP